MKEGRIAPTPFSLNNQKNNIGNSTSLPKKEKSRSSPSTSLLRVYYSVSFCLYLFHIRRGRIFYDLKNLFELLIPWYHQEVKVFLQWWSISIVLCRGWNGFLDDKGLFLQSKVLQSSTGLKKREEWIPAQNSLLILYNNYINSSTPIPIPLFNSRSNSIYSYIWKSNSWVALQVIDCRSCSSKSVLIISYN